MRRTVRVRRVRVCGSGYAPCECDACAGDDPDAPFRRRHDVHLHQTPHVRLAPYY